jgi:hypothetical protein
MASQAVQWHVRQGEEPGLSSESERGERTAHPDSRPKSPSIQTEFTVDSLSTLVGDVETLKFTISPEPLTTHGAPVSWKAQLEDTVTHEQFLTVRGEDLSLEGKGFASTESTDTLPPAGPAQFHEFLEHVYPSELFENLHLNDILQLRLVSRTLKRLVDDYLVDITLPFTRLIFHYRAIGDIEYPNRVESNYEHLIPIIRRSKRAFPHNRLVYEPEGRGTRKLLLHQIQPDQIKLVVPSEQGEQTLTFPLNPHRDEYKKSHDRRDRGRRSHLLTFEYTNVHRYYRFDRFEDPPIHVFYKERLEGDKEYVELHCISIPLDFLRAQLLQSHVDNLKRIKNFQLSV